MGSNVVIACVDDWPDSMGRVQEKLDRLPSDENSSIEWLYVDSFRSPDENSKRLSLNNPVTVLPSTLRDTDDKLLKCTPKISHTTFDSKEHMQSMARTSYLYKSFDSNDPVLIETQV